MASSSGVYLPEWAGVRRLCCHFCVHWWLQFCGCLFIAHLCDCDCISQEGGKLLYPSTQSCVHLVHRNAAFAVSGKGRGQGKMYIYLRSSFLSSLAKPQAELQRGVIKMSKYDVRLLFFFFLFFFFFPLYQKMLWPEKLFISGLSKDEWNTQPLQEAPGSLSAVPIKCHSGQWFFV